jgi:hypothetical protein
MRNSRIEAKVDSSDLREHTCGQGKTNKVKKKQADTLALCPMYCMPWPINYISIIHRKCKSGVDFFEPVVDPAIARHVEFGLDLVCFVKLHSCGQAVRWSAVNPSSAEQGYHNVVGKGRGSQPFGNKRGKRLKKHNC